MCFVRSIRIGRGVRSAKGGRLQKPRHATRSAAGIALSRPRVRVARSDRPSIRPRPTCDLFMTEIDITAPRYFQFKRPSVSLPRRTGTAPVTGSAIKRFSVVSEVHTNYFSTGLGRAYSDVSVAEAWPRDDSVTGRRGAA